MDIKAPNVMTRLKVTTPLFTGVKVVDSMFPIGRGQRQLLLGDKLTGKKTIALDTIVAQRRISPFLTNNYPIFCFYVLVGQRIIAVKGVLQTLSQCKAMPYSSIILTRAVDTATTLFLAPFAGCTVAEHFRNSGLDSLVIYDNLGTQANAYRQMALAMRRPPGREAFPGDIFFLHARLLERAGQCNLRGNFGSITAFPMISTVFGRVSAYIPTNLISITDGQIYTSAKTFKRGVRPAVDTGLSVSRIGGAAQDPGLNKYRPILIEFLRKHQRLRGTGGWQNEKGELYDTLVHGEKLMRLMEQNRQTSVPPEVFTFILNLLFDKRVHEVPYHNTKLLEKFVNAVLYSKMMYEFWLKYAFLNKNDLFDQKFLNRLRSIITNWSIKASLPGNYDGPFVNFGAQNLKLLSQMQGVNELSGLFFLDKIFFKLSKLIQPEGSLLLPSFAFENNLINNFKTFKN